ncbi:MAG: hypothetical protein JW904_08855 [Spirochaetales bacterium]|nr:hypothetical protein [Spirochaetales bacterium]
MLLHPVRFLVIGYFLITFLGAFLLSLPFSTTTGESQNILDSFFTASSGISTTGLVVVDTGTYYSFFGQIILLIIFQIGGIGYMTVIVVFVFSTGNKTSLRLGQIAVNSISGANIHFLGRFFAFVVIFTLVCEAVGAMLLAFEFSRTLPLGEAVYSGIFHSVSAFCTAGFSLNSNSFMDYRDNLLVNMTINTLSIAGAVGFIVLFEIFLHAIPCKIKKIKYKFSLHLKLVFLATPLIIILAALIILFSEQWDPSTALGWRINASFFQAISASTTDGFNTMDIGVMSKPGIFTFLPLMFIGASPGSTGGGIKLTTFVVILVFLFHHIRGNDNRLVIFKRQIGVQTVIKAFSVFFWFCLIIFIDILVLLAVETVRFDQIVFEVFSAMGNTGLSMGITGGLNPLSKLLLTATMFIGRVGPLAFGLTFVAGKKILSYGYPEEDVFVA